MLMSISENENWSKRTQMIRKIIYFLLSEGLWAVSTSHTLPFLHVEKCLIDKNY